jgi:hypothetical protein
LSMDFTYIQACLSNSWNCLWCYFFPVTVHAVHEI